MRTVTWSILCACIGFLIGGVACFGSELIISEIAWAGSAASSADEWIELQNQGEDSVALAGWTLSYGDVLIPLGEIGEDALDVRVSTLEAGAFFILERTDDTSISDIVADVIYTGTLSNSGVRIELRDPEGNIVDSVEVTESGWCAGSASDGDLPYCTMERTSDGGWASNNGIIRNGLDVEGNPLNGTPGQPNSAQVLAQWAPLIECTFPSDVGDILSGMETVTWEASDPNGEDSALSIAILLSDNDGEDWTLLIENLANTGSFSWDTSMVPSGTDYRLLFRAADSEGYVGESISPSFEILGSGG
ncbi:lamin tail domain-containing protein [Candidatus Bipolaricaulota bacterium]|nr:lamin tail domain-containing protein [Candidatus Bipolaricaulota bacterium]